MRKGSNLVLAHKGLIFRKILFTLSRVEHPWSLCSVGVHVHLQYSTERLAQRTLGTGVVQDTVKKPSQTPGDRNQGFSQCHSTAHLIVPCVRVLCLQEKKAMSLHVVGVIIRKLLQSLHAVGVIDYL